MLGVTAHSRPKLPLRAVSIIIFLGIAFWAAGYFLRALWSREIALPARGGGTYWLRRATRPIYYWWFVGIFAAAALMGLWLAIMFMLGK